MKNIVSLIIVALICGCASNPAPITKPTPPTPGPPIPQPLPQPIQKALRDSATAGSTNQYSTATLAWTPSQSSQVVGYNIFTGIAPGQYTNQINAGASTNLQVSGLVVGQTYHFAATAYDDLGIQSPYSAEAIYTVPAPVQNVYALITSYLEVSTNNLNWSTAFIFSGMVITNPPSPEFFRARMTINYTTNTLTLP